LASDLAAITAKVMAEGINPAPRSGRQERLENLVNRYL
jgi:xylose isomerase